MADLDSILSGKGEATPAPEPTAAPEPSPATQPVPDATGRLHGEGGRFAPKTAAEAETAPTTPAPTPSPPEPAPTPAPTAPVAAVTAERAKRQGAEAEAETLRSQLATQQAQIQQLERMLQGVIPRPKPPDPEPPPDPYADPAAFRDYGIRQALTPLQEQLEDHRQAVSRTMAEDKFGPEVVDGALQALAAAMGNDPNAQDDYQRIMKSPHPYAALVTWHKKRATLEKIGDDPEAFIEAEIARRLEVQQQPGTQPAGNGATRPAPVLPTNLAGARGVGSRSGPEWGGPAALKDIFDRRNKPGG